MQYINLQYMTNERLPSTRILDCTSSHEEKAQYLQLVRFQFQDQKDQKKIHSYSGLKKDQEEYKKTFLGLNNKTEEFLLDDYIIEEMQKLITLTLVIDIKELSSQLEKHKGERFTLKEYLALKESLHEIAFRKHTISIDQSSARLYEATTSSSAGKDSCKHCDNFLLIKDELIKLGLKNDFDEISSLIPKHRETEFYQITAQEHKFFRSLSTYLSSINEIAKIVALKCSRSFFFYEKKDLHKHIKKLILLHSYFKQYQNILSDYLNDFLQKHPYIVDKTKSKNLKIAMSVLINKLKHIDAKQELIEKLQSIEKCIKKHFDITVISERALERVQSLLKPGTICATTKLNPMMNDEVKKVILEMGAEPCKICRY